MANGNTQEEQEAAALLKKRQASADQLRSETQRRFQDIRGQQDLDRAAAQRQAQEVFGEGSLGRVEEGRAGEVSDLLNIGRQQLDTGASGLDEAIARRRQTISTGGQDPSFQRIGEAARRAQDVQTQTSLRQLRGELGSQGVRGGINLQQQLGTLGRANLAESQLQGQLAQARLARLSEAESAEEGLQRSRIDQQRGALAAQASGIERARSEEAGRVATNVQRSLQERLGRLQLVEGAAQRGVLERSAAAQEVGSEAQLQSQREAAAESNRIALIQANKPAAAPVQQGGKVLCTELCDLGLLDPYLLEADLLYATTISPITKVGYWIWAKPLAESLRTSPILTKVVTPFVRAWATEMAYKVGYVRKGSILGKLMTVTCEPACYLLGKTLLALNLVNMEEITSHVILGRNS